MRNNKRETWIDIARLLSMLFIIIGHVPCYEVSIRDYLTTFHVPIFFIISGYLYHPNKFNIELRKSFVALIIPYICLGLINCLYWSLFDIYVQNKSISICAKSYIQQFITMSVGLPMIGPLWFLIVLFLIRVIMVFLQKTKILLGICIFFVGISYLINIYFLDSLFYAPICIFLALPFFALGYIMQEKKLIYKILNLPIKPRLSITSLFFILSVTLFLYQGSSNISTHDYGENIVTFYICAICGTIFIISTASFLKIKKKKILICLQTANNGLPIMIGLQIILINCINHIIGIYAFHTSGALLISLTVMFITYPLTIASMKYFPAILGRRQITTTQS